MATGLLFVFNLICGLVVSLMDSNSNAIVGIICDRFHTVDRSIDSIGYFAKCSGRTASSTMAREWWVEVVVNGPKRKALIGHPWYGLEWKRDPRLCESYFDGEVLAEHWLNQRRFQIYKSIPESRIASVERIKTEFVFECTGVWPLTTRYDGGKNASSIAHILDSSSSWNVTECTFEGQPCVSVCNDWHSLLFSKLHGFSLRRRFSKFEDNEKMSAMFCNDNLTEVVPGIWMPQNFSRTIYLGELNRFPELSVDMREESVYSSVKHEIQTFFLNQPDRTCLPRSFFILAGFALRIHLATEVLVGTLDQDRLSVL